MREHVFAMTWRPPDAWSYSYLLGMYLGDGCISNTGRRSYQLVITCALDYPDIIDDCVTAVVLTLLSRSVRCNRHRVSRCVRVTASCTRWPEAFPQHGPGRKHSRRIELAPWQREIVDRFPQEFLRGLLHSDGCRTVNRFKTKLPSGRVAEYAYPRWFFSNRSADIRGLFCEYCERLGIRWTQSNPRNISISHRTSVALVDSFVPAKS
jgi:hypothetical protein